MFPPTFQLIESIDLFNILNAEINGLARISDPNYLYLLGLSDVFVWMRHFARKLDPRSFSDCRSRKDYDESHIISARLIQRVSFSLKMIIECNAISSFYQSLWMDNIDYHGMPN